MSRFLPGQLTPIKKKQKQKQRTKQNKTLKHVERAGTASHLDLSLLERGEIGGES